ncbi:HAD hydrolase-like protein [Williamsia sp. CHRR-6]|nr:HAD hydrolase-like protein [Williamsia sp. CHRR-6]MBT0565340.1 HAD hydrolase-like protein [Williamsia sp. CHRR-6]
MLLFDLDGTITDSAAGIVGSFRHALRSVGHPEPADDVIAGIVGPPMIDTLRGCGLTEDAAHTAMAHYRSHYSEVGWAQNAVYPGMAELLADLAAAGRTLAVATSKNQATAHRILSHFGLVDHFVYVAGASGDGTRRAKSDVIAHALCALGVQPRRGPDRPDGLPVVMIGDRSHDVDGAAEFGIPVALVGWGYSLPGEGERARWHISTVAALRGVLGV